MIIFLKNQNGLTKRTKLGFSWTMLFFGIFVPLIRGDFKWAIITLLAAAVTCGISWLVFPFIYNKIYIKEHLQNGWIPADEMSENALKSKGYM